MKINFENKIQMFKAISEKNSNGQPVIKITNSVRPSNDNLSQSIRNKKDADNFIKELKTAFSKNNK